MFYKGSVKNSVAWKNDGYPYINQRGIRRQGVWEGKGRKEGGGCWKSFGQGMERSN